MSIAQTQNESHHGHDRRCACKSKSAGQPFRGFWECFQKPFMEHGGEPMSSLVHGKENHLEIYNGKIRDLKSSAASLSEASLIFLKFSDSSEDWMEGGQRAP